MKEICTGEQLVVLRRRNRLTQADVANLLQWDRQRYSRIERTDDLKKSLRYYDFVHLNEALSHLLDK